MPDSGRGRSTRSTRRPPRKSRGAAQSSPRGELGEYRRKRDFAHTPEPSAEVKSNDGGPLTFVVQKHHASRLHYDLRLEVDGVLKSWPVPKGPSLDPDARRLAVMTEDHPLDYASFEGVIPKGQYGAGEVIVWDHGTYSPDEGGVISFHDREQAEQRMRDGLVAGKLSVQLRGSKLKGSWALVKTKQSAESWLLIKHRDEAADAGRDIVEEDASVISGLTIAELKAGRLPDRTRESTPVRPVDLPGVKRARFPGTVKPMQATLSEGAFSNPQWLFEPKLDGIRAIASTRNGETELRSRTGRAMTEQYPSLIEELARQPAHSLVLDGEIVALDGRGVPSFEALQQRMNLLRGAEIQQAEAAVPVVYFVFDLLYLDGYDLRGVPLRHRKELLARVLLPCSRVQRVQHFDGEGEQAFEASVRLGLEGLVAKRLDGVYESGKRSRRWLKLKARRADEFVVCGFSAGNGARAHSFGALVLGTHDGEGRLVPVGRVGTGFDDRTLAEFRARLDRITRKTSPLAFEPAEGTSGVTWVRPQLVVEVQFANWTSDGHLRAPVFVRLRDDKPAADVRRAAVGAPPEAASEEPRPAAGLEDEVRRVLDQLDDERKTLTLAVEGHELKLTNLDKVMWPAVRIGRRRQRALTKRDLLVYLATVSVLLLPHLRDRPLTLTRYPNGIEGHFFYQKRYEHAADFVETFRAYSDTDKGDQQYMVCNNLATLLWLGQVADLALHTSLARIRPEPDGSHLSAQFTGSKRWIEASLLNYPDFALFDLDPYMYSGTEAQGEEPELNRKAFRKTAEVAMWLKELLDSASLSSFVKTSGATGLHIYVPVLRHFDYGVIRSIAETLGGFLVQAHPRDVTMEWSVEKRTGKVFFDANQNVRIKNLAAVYSPRAKPGAPVSMPLRWDELSEVYPTDFTILTAPARIEQLGDLWAGILDAKHDLQALLDSV